MVGVLPPTSGTVKIGDFDIQKNPIEAKKLIGYIPDIPYVYPYMTGREFLHFVAELYRVKNKEKKIEKSLKTFPIEGMIDGYFRDFSRGTKQKLSIVAALLHEPKVLIIDEPILGLDPKASLITKKLLKDFSKNGGTVFVCTHTLDVIEEIADRIGIIDKAELVFEGDMDQLQKRLKTKEEKLEELFFKITK